MIASPKAIIEPLPRCRVDGEGIVAGQGHSLNLLCYEDPKPLHLSDNP